MYPIQALPNKKQQLPKVSISRRLGQENIDELIEELKRMGFTEFKLVE